MKRREYCSLSKSVSQYVLDQILSGEATEIVVERIHEYLATIGDDVRCGKINSTSSSSTSGWAKIPRTTPTPRASRTCRSRSG
jgi:DNA polymerase alpha subunit A